MTNVDYAVLLLYLVGTLAISVVVSVRNKSTDDMFAAGGQSPWWVSGLSGFMTMFSAGTFVVWGGIAYKYGLVAITINLCYGIAALLVGFTLAGRWNSMGIRTPAEFIDLRFGRGALHFYTACMTAFKVFGTAVSIYALSVIMTDMMPLAEGNPLRDPHTGNLSLLAAIVGLGGLVVLYTVIGGLWGVLMTDVLQFIVLNLAVLLVVPLAIARAGGLRAIVSSSPDGFFHPTGGGYTWGFLIGWVVIHYFVVGAEWAFVQRYISVSSPLNARKGAYLFGALYLLSPFLWLAPPLAYRTIQPLPPEGLSLAMIAELTPRDYDRLPKNAGRALRTGETSLLADHEIASLRESSIGTLGERAYSRVCMAVLPIGMMGMMLAAMFSATASTVSGHLNVFAGVLTHDIYRNWLNSRGRKVGETHLVRAGRIFTLGLGAVIVALALAVPRLGGAERVIVAVTTFMTVPLLAPVLAGFFSRRVSAAAVWITAMASACAALILKFILVPDGTLARAPGMHRVVQWITEHERTAEMLFAVGLPVATLMAVHLLGRGISPGSERVRGLLPLQRSMAEQDTNREMASIVAWCLAVCSVVVGLLIFANDNHRGTLIAFSTALALLSAVVFRSTTAARSSRQEASRVEA